MEVVIVVLGTVVAMLGWCATVGWHRSGRAEERAGILERLLADKRETLRAPWRALSALLSRTP